MATSHHQVATLLSLIFESIPIGRVSIPYIICAPCPAHFALCRFCLFGALVIDPFILNFARPDSYSELVIISTCCNHWKSNPRLQSSSSQTFRSLWTLYWLPRTCWLQYLRFFERMKFSILATILGLAALVTADPPAQITFPRWWARRNHTVLNASV